MRLPLGALALLTIASGCVKVRVARRADVDASSTPVSTTRSSLVAADSMLAIAAGSSFANAMRDVLGERAIVLFANAPTANGRTAALSAIERLSSSAVKSMTWRALVADVSTDGSMGYTFGRGTSRSPSGESAAAGYLAVWQRASEGAPWRIAAMVLTGGGDGALPPECVPPVTIATKRVSRAVATREAMRADSMFARDADARGASIAFRDWSAPHGSMVGVGDAPVCGPAAIGAALEGTPIGAVQWNPIAGDAAESGDLAFTVGHAKWTTGPSPRYVHYLSIWRRFRDGRWKYVSDAGVPCGF